MKATFSTGSFVKINPENDNDNYDKYRGKCLVVTRVSKSVEDHPGYDTGVNEPLYDLRTLDGKEVPFSLYEYELAPRPKPLGSTS